MVNSSFAAQYRLDLDGVDGISLLARSFLEAVSDQREVVLADGSELRGVLHSELTVSEARCICGRTLDLEAAYKQLLVKETSLWASVLLVAAPSGERHYISQVLPFGASATVFAFNRLARAIHAVGPGLGCSISSGATFTMIIRSWIWVCVET